MLPGVDIGIGVLILPAAGDGDGHGWSGFAGGTFVVVPSVDAVLGVGHGEGEATAFAGCAGA